MVEMVETANILHHATNRSLLILDEIGRGNEHLRWAGDRLAVVEYTTTPRPARQDAVATHYHELTTWPSSCRTWSLQRRGWPSRDTVCLPAQDPPRRGDRSYGVHVRSWPGCPGLWSLARRKILGELEAVGRGRPAALCPARPTVFQLPLFSAEDP